MRVSDLKIGETVHINGHDYTYNGQQKRKQTGFKATFYVFNQIGGNHEKTFNLSAKIEIKRIGNALHLQPSK